MGGSGSKDVENDEEEEQVHQSAEVESKLLISVLPWVVGKGRTKYDRDVTPTEVAELHGVPRSIVVTYIANEVEETEACLSLPFTLLLVASYALMAISHDNAAVIRAVEESIEFDILENANFAWTGPNMGHKGMEDVNSVADFWSWMRLGLAPLVFQQSRGFHEGYGSLEGTPATWFAEKEGPSGRGLILHYNRIVGGIRLIQERSGPPSACTTDKLCAKAYDNDCVFGLGYELDPEVWDARLTDEDMSSGTDKWLYAFEDSSKHQEKLTQWEADQWFDRQTRKIEVAIPVYNAEYGLHSLIYCNFFINRGGHIYKKIIALSAWADWFDHWTKIVYDVVWAMCSLYIFCTELWEILKITRQSGCQAVFTEYVGFWNAFDWCSVFAAFSLMTMFIISVEFTGEVNDSLATMSTLETNTPKIQNHLQKVEHAVHYIHKLRLGLVAYAFIVGIRLCKAFSKQPRLAIATNTLRNATKDLLHFLLVFFSVFLAFAISGIVFFGREVAAFGTFARAMNACFRIVMGDLQWDETSKVGRIEAGLWSWLFIGIVVMVLLNMVLAIVMDHYVVMKTAAGNAETLYAEAMETWTRWRQVRRGEAVSMEEVLLAMKREEQFQKDEKERKEVEFIDDDPGPKPDAEGQDEGEDYQGPKLTVQDLQDIFSRFIPGGEMPEDQAKELLVGAVNDYYAEHLQDADLQEVQQLTRKVGCRSKKLCKMAKQATSQARKFTGGARVQLEALQAFADELAEFSRELCEERKVMQQEASELRMEKRGLLRNLQMQIPPEEWQEIEYGFGDPHTAPPGGWRLCHPPGKLAAMLEEKPNADTDGAALLELEEAPSIATPASEAPSDGDPFTAFDRIRELPPCD